MNAATKPRCAATAHEDVILPRHATDPCNSERWVLPPEAARSEASEAPASSANRAEAGSDDSAATARPRIVSCQRCGSHLKQRTDELICDECAKWAEILGRLSGYRRAVRR
jgi:hypothetical protein